MVTRSSWRGVITGWRVNSRAEPSAGEGAIDIPTIREAIKKNHGRRRRGFPSAEGEVWVLRWGDAEVSSFIATTLSAKHYPRNWQPLYERKHAEEGWRYFRLLVAGGRVFSKAWTRSGPFAGRGSPRRIRTRSSRERKDGRTHLAHKARARGQLGDGGRCFRGPCRMRGTAIRRRCRRG